MFIIFIHFVTYFNVKFNKVYNVVVIIFTFFFIY